MREWSDRKRSGWFFPGGEQPRKAMKTAMFALFAGFMALVGYALLASPSTGGHAGRMMRVDGDFHSILPAIRMYIVDNGRPPTTAQGLSSLVAEPVTGPVPMRWRPLMDRIPVDPWQTPYRYELLTPKAREWRWEFRSAGPDCVFDNADDLASEFEYGPGRAVGEETSPSD